MGAYFQTNNSAMRAPLLPLLSTLFCLLAHAAPTHAQAAGLKLKSLSEGVTLHSTDSGLRLQYIGPASFAGEPSAGQSAALNLSTPTLRNSLRADWLVPGQGLHTSLGVSWNAQGKSFAATSSLPSSLNPTPFMGLGWQPGAKQSSRWKLSAEIGTAFSGEKACPSIAVHCNSGPGNGFNLQSNGSGLRLNPYVNFGATFSFDQ